MRSIPHRFGTLPAGGMGGAHLRQLLIRWLAGAAVFVLEPSPPARPAAITGRLVDAVCYKLDKANLGASHELPSGTESDCARDCVRTGLPAALLTTDGALYIVSGAVSANYNAALLPYLGHTVTLTGEVTEIGGTMLSATRVSLESNDGLK